MYDFDAVERKWRDRWEAEGLHAAPPAPRRKHYVLVMFAYPSGDIHMGHFRNYTIGDVAARFLRMNGRDVLHPFGWDAFGLPAEQAAIKRGIHPRDWTLANIETGRKTLRQMSISYDWDREVRTCLPDYYRWTQWMFLQMHRRGLAHRSASDVNWCETCNTVLANEQVHDGTCWRCASPVGKRSYEQWYFKLSAYAQRLLDGLDGLPGWPETIKTLQRNWIGRSEGAEIDFPLEGASGTISVYTTRPDTIYGVTFMSIAPESPLAAALSKGTPQEQAVREYIAKAASKSEIERTSAGEKDGVFTGRYVTNPLNGERVALWVGDYVLAHYGTGVVMGVPAHDTRDFAFAKKYGIPIRVVIQPPGQTLDPATMPDAYVDPGIMVNSGPFDGMPSEEGIGKVIRHAAEKGVGRAKVNYKLRDWLISRQRYWGCPIPMVHCPGCGIVPVPDKDLPVLLPDVKDYIPKGRSPLADEPAFVNTACPQCGKPAKRDPDTMDTFMCSSWYMLRYADPKNAREPFAKEAAATWLPVDLYIGGAEHACMHLIYFRFFMKVLFDAGLVPCDEPAVRLFNQGMVKDAKGDVMSKSKGNAVSPAALFAAHGVDAARVAMAFFAPSSDDISWKEEGVVGARRLLGRIQDFVSRHAEWIKGLSSRPGTPTPEPGTADPGPAKTIRRLAHATLQRATEAYGSDFAFNTVVSKIYELLNALEKTGEPASLGAAERAAVAEAVRLLTIVLAPLAPHLAEELWTMTGHATLVAREPWPAFDAAALALDEIEIPVQVNGKLRGKIVVPAGAPEETLREKALADPKVREALQGRPPKKVIVVPNKLVNVVVA
jgi:leucyl-tRNA synthetase